MTKLSLILLLLLLVVLSLLQMQLPALTPAQLVIALASMCEMGGRPPQAWLASHETALLNTNSRSPSNEALSPKVRPCKCAALKAALLSSFAPWSCFTHQQEIIT
jgi:hypothetical protein